MQRPSSIALAVALAAALCSACREETDPLADARTALAKKDSASARIHLLTALQRDPKSAQARFLLGTVLLDMGNAAEAAIELGKAQSMGQAAELVVPPLARALVRQGEYRKVVSLGLAPPALAEQDMADLQTSLAQAQFALKNATAGEVALKEALRIAPDYLPARALRTQRLAASGELEAALRYSQETLQKVPGDPSAWLEHADLLAGSPERADEAIAAYRKAVELQGDLVRGHSGALTLLLARRDATEAGRELQALRKSRPDHSATTFFEAQLALLRGDTAAARVASDKLLAVAPTNPAYVRLAASVSLEAGELSKAVGQLAAAVQANLTDRSLRRMLTLALLRNGDARQAFATVQPLLQDKTPDTESLTLAAVAALQSGERAQAEKLFASAAKLAPTSPHVQATLAMSRLASPDGHAALADLERLARADSAGALDKIVVNALIQRKEFDRALKAIAALEAKLPNDPAASMMRGELNLRRGDAQAARAAFQQAVDRAPGYFPATGALAQLDLRDGDTRKARQRFEALLKRDPRNTGALVALAKLNRMTGAPEQETSKLLADAIHADPLEPGIRQLLVEHELAQGHWRAALAAADAAVQAMPTDPRLVATQARVCMLGKSYDQAALLFGKLAALQPSDPSPLRQLARAQMALHRPDQARQALHQAVKLAPAAVDSQVDLARLEISAGKPAEALVIARRLQQQWPADPVGFVLAAESAASRNDWTEAQAGYMAALGKNKGRGTAAMGLHAVLVKAGKSGEADSFASRWLREQPKDINFVQYLGDRALLASDFARAETLYQRVLQAAPDNAAALNNLAWALHKLQRPAALGYAEKAVKLAPTEPAYLDTLAQLLASAGRREEAVPQEARAVELAPDHPGYRLELARLYAQTGDKARARAELDRLSALGLKYTGHEKVQEVRRSLGAS